MASRRRGWLGSSAGSGRDRRWASWAGSSNGLHRSVLRVRRWRWVAERSAHDSGHAQLFGTRSGWRDDEALRPRRRVDLDLVRAAVDVVAEDGEVALDKVARLWRRDEDERAIDPAHDLGRELLKLAMHDDAQRAARAGEVERSRVPDERLAEVRPRRKVTQDLGDVGRCACVATRVEPAFRERGPDPLSALRQLRDHAEGELGVASVELGQLGAVRVERVKEPERAKVSSCCV